jgi:hypothetical protein
MAPFCSNCGTPFQNTARFCVSCGAALVVAGTGPTTAQAVSAPPQEPPPTLADPILAVEPGSIREGLFRTTPYVLILSRSRVVFVLVSKTERDNAARQASLAGKAVGQDIYQRQDASRAAIRRLYADFAMWDPMMTAETHPGSLVAEKADLARFVYAPSFSAKDTEGDTVDFPPSLEVRTAYLKVHFDFEDGADEQTLKRVTERFQAG